MIKIIDCKTYWKVVFDNIEMSTFPKKTTGFGTKEELFNWLRRKDAYEA